MGWGGVGGGGGGAGRGGARLVARAESECTGEFKMAATMFRAVQRGWRTGVPPGCGLRRLVRALSVKLGAEGGVEAHCISCSLKTASLLREHFSGAQMKD